MKAINVKITATTTLKDFETSNPETTSIICFEITSEKLTKANWNLEAKGNKESLQVGSKFGHIPNIKEELAKDGISYDEIVAFATSIILKIYSPDPW